MNLNSNFLHKKTLWNKLLLPLSYLYRSIIFIRKILYQKAILFVYRAPRPVIVVGSITVGGTGKTSVVIAIVKHLQNKGLKVGIVSRGYGGHSKTYPIEVSSNSIPLIVGDEAVLIARHTHAPFFVDPNRPNAVKALLKKYDCDVILSDDGLQHYALARDLEIVVMDSKRRFGNGLCLPSGPLREPIARLKKVDFILMQGEAQKNQFAFHYIFQSIQNLLNNQIVESFESFKQQKIHAVAAIGDPERFFSMLKNQGLDIIPHIFPDHYLFQAKDFDFLSQHEKVIMTEKDAVKCLSFARENFWFIPTHIILSEDFFASLFQACLTIESFSNRFKTSSANTPYNL